MERQPFGWRLAVGAWRGSILAAVLFVLLSIAFTWPLAPNLSRAVADPGDPLINIWILDWDHYATLHHPFSLFEANAFHPGHLSLAYSENLFGLALLLFPVRLAGVGPVVAYNLALLAGFAFCGFTAFLLGKRLTGSSAAGVAAGVFYAFVPFRFVHLSHVQHVWGGWLPLLLLALLHYADAPSWKRGWMFAAVFLINGLTNIHYLLFGAFAAAVTAVLLVPRKQWRELAVPTSVALLLLAPFLAPYAEVAKLYGMQRTWEEVWSFSATPSNWLPGTTTEPEKKLYPGALALVISGLAFFVARREKAKLALALLWIAIGFAGSLGLRFVFHQFLFGAVPGFKAIRAPSRWAVIAYVGIAVLIALFTAGVARRNRWLAWLVPIAFAVTLWQAPVRWFLLDPKTPPVYTWLAKQKVEAIAELPMDKYSSDYDYMLFATAHHQRFVGGVSGFAPPLRGELSRLSRDLTDSFIDRLREGGVELLIVHSDRYGTDAVPMRAWLQRELDRGRLRYVTHFDAKAGADWVFSLRGGAGPQPHELAVFLFGGATCLSSVSGALELPATNTVGGASVLFQGWASSPKGIASVDLWFENRRVRHRAVFRPIDRQSCPGPAPVRFSLSFASRPKDICATTDVQVEITDGSGAKAALEDRWLRWE